MADPPRGGTTGQHDRIKIGAQLLGRDINPDVDAGPELGALSLHLLEPPIQNTLFHLELGDAVAKQTTDAVLTLEDGDFIARRVSCCAAARPAGPEPTTATVLPVSVCGGSGFTQPSSKALSMISSSICLIVTGSWLIPSTHAGSHGAGHSRP